MNKTLLRVLGLCVSPNFRYSLKSFTEIYRVQYENAILVYFRGTPRWQPENSRIWKKLWPSRSSRLLIISSEINKHLHKHFS